MNHAAPDSVILVADIGGTFARFGLAYNDQLMGKATTLERSCANDLISLCKLALREFNTPVSGAAIAVAAPVANGRAQMTNVGWEVDEPALAASLSLEQVLLVNDFAALALCLPTLKLNETLRIPSCQTTRHESLLPPAAAAPRIVFGPGTGLGVAALFQHGEQLLPIASEGGHIGFAPITDFEQKILAHATTRFQRVSWERILSGPGLELIHQVSCGEFGEPAMPATAAEIIEAARQGNSATAIHSVACFSDLLGSFGGDLALMFRASGGVTICGGIAARIAAMISPSQLRERFNHKGRFSDWLDTVPLSILLNSNAALTGAARAYRQRFPQPGQITRLC